MNRKATYIVLSAILLAFASVSIAPRPVRAQFPQFFGATRFPSIQVDNNDHLYMAMSVATAPISEHRPHSQIFFTQSKDGGKTWDNLPHTRNLTNTPGEAFGPSLAVSQQNPLLMYIAYQDDSTGTTQAYILRTKKKTKFRRQQNLTPTSSGFSPRIALDAGGNINLVYDDTGNNVRQVGFMRSTDQGATFSDPKIISGDSTGAFEPELVMTSGNVINVAWEDSGAGTSVILFSQSTDNGDSFSTPRQISGPGGDATEAHIAADSTGRVSVVWVQVMDDGKHAFYVNSTDGGQTFSTPLQISRSTGESISKPFALAFHDSVYVAYQDEVPGNKQVFLTHSEDAGLTFNKPIQISDADNRCGRAHSPAMTVDSKNTVHIVWIDASRVSSCGDEGLLFYSRTTNGQKFTPEQMIIAGI